MCWVLTAPPPTHPPTLPPSLSIPALQCPDKHQRYISHVLGVPMHKVVVRTKRLGELALFGFISCLLVKSGQMAEAD